MVSSSIYYKSIHVALEAARLNDAGAVAADIDVYDPAVPKAPPSLTERRYNGFLRGIFDRQMADLRCTTADNVRELLLSSERVFIDLLEALGARNEDPEVCSVVLHSVSHQSTVEGIPELALSLEAN